MKLEGLAPWYGHEGLQNKISSSAPTTQSFRSSINCFLIRIMLGPKAGVAQRRVRGLKGWSRCVVKNKPIGNSLFPVGWLNLHESRVNLRALQARHEKKCSHVVTNSFLPPSMALPAATNKRWRKSWTYILWTSASTPRKYGRITIIR